MLFLYICLFYHLLIITVGIYKDITKYNIKFNNLKKRFWIKNIKKADILIHSVSCGESKLMLPLVKMFKSRNYSIKFSIHTPSGFELLQNHTDTVFLKPYDNFFIMFYMFFIIRPKILIISVSDTWPMYILCAKIFKCQIIYVNYKIKPKKKLRNALHYYIADKIYLRDKINLYSDQYKKYKYLGDLKILSNTYMPINKTNKYMVITIASANENEIGIHLQLIEYLLNRYLNIKIIYVPRHLNWINNFKSSFRHLKYNFINTIEEIHKCENKILVCWKYGLLANIYSKSHICLMGDTFNNVGGHNLIEPAIKKNVILTGPNVITCINHIKIIKYVIITSSIEELIKNVTEIIKNKKYILYGNENYRSILDKKSEILVNLNLLEQEL